jgi:hypothetical protein
LSDHFFTVKFSQLSQFYMRYDLLCLRGGMISFSIMCFRKPALVENCLLTTKCIAN